MTFSIGILSPPPAPRIIAGGDTDARRQSFFLGLVCPVVVAVVFPPLALLGQGSWGCLLGQAHFFGCRLSIPFPPHIPPAPPLPQGGGGLAVDISHEVRYTIYMAGSKRSYGNIFLGLAVRGTIADTTTFRVRRGNGFWGSILGRRYYDKFNYTVPTSITNTEGQPYRDSLATAVSNWKNNLTDDQKSVYNYRASLGLHMSGYNLYIKEYILDLI